MSHFPHRPSLGGLRWKHDAGFSKKTPQEATKLPKLDFFSGLLSTEFTKPAGTGLMGSQRRTNSRLQTDPDGCLTGRLEFLQSYITHLQGGEGDDRTKEGGRGWKKEGKQHWFSFFSPLVLFFFSHFMWCSELQNIVLICLFRSGQRVKCEISVSTSLCHLCEQPGVDFINCRWTKNVFSLRNTCTCKKTN